MFFFSEKEAVLISESLWNDNGLEAIGHTWPCALGH